MALNPDHWAPHIARLDGPTGLRLQTAAELLACRRLLPGAEDARTPEQVQRAVARLADMPGDR